MINVILSPSPNTPFFQFQRRRSSNPKANKQRQKSPFDFVFSRQTWSLMTIELRRVSSSHGIPGISNRNIWSNGKRPRCFLIACTVFKSFIGTRLLCVFRMPYPNYSGKSIGSHHVSWRVLGTAQRELSQLNFRLFVSCQLTPSRPSREAEDIFGKFAIGWKATKVSYPWQGLMVIASQCVLRLATVIITDTRLDS